MQERTQANAGGGGGEQPDIWAVDSILCRLVNVLPIGEMFCQQFHAVQDETVISIAKDVGKTPAEVLLRWGLQHGTSVIPEGRSESHQTVSAVQLLACDPHPPPPHPPPPPPTPPPPGSGGAPFPQNMLRPAAWQPCPYRGQGISSDAE